MNPHQWITDVLHPATLHIYREKGDGPPCQLSTEALHTATLHIYTLNAAYNEVTFNEKLPIMKENLCTKYTPFTYKYITLNKKLSIMKQNLCIFFFIIGRVDCIYIEGRWTPMSIEHRGIAYCYTAYIYIYIDGPPSQSNTEALHTTTPNKYIGPPQSIEHRGLEYHYTKQIYRSSPVN